MSGPSTVQIQIVPAVDPAATATALGSLNATQLATLASAMMTAMLALDITTTRAFIQGLLTVVPPQSIWGATPPLGQAYKSNSGFLEFGQ